LKDPALRLKLARLYARGGQNARAINQYQMCLDLDPKNAAARKELTALIRRWQARGEMPSMTLLNGHVARLGKGTMREPCRLLRFAILLAAALTLIAGYGCAHQAPSGLRSHPPEGERTGGGAPDPAGTPNTAEGSEGALFRDVAQAAGLNYRWEIPGKRPLNILQTIGNGCAFLDYDSDGWLDILLVGPKLALFRNPGVQVFRRSGVTPPQSPPSQGGGQGGVLNTRTPEHPLFEDVTRATGLDRFTGHFLGCAVGDYDNNGYDDLYLTAYRGGALLHNESGVEGRESKVERDRLSTPGSRVFRDVTKAAGIAPQPWTTACAFVDIDNDGRLDLYLGNYVIFGPSTQPQLCEYSGHMSACGPRFYQPERGALYRNEGGGKFRDVSRTWGVHQATGKALGIACADFDDSGRQSIALANDEVAGDLLLNLGGKFKNIGAESSTAYDASGNVHGGMGIDWGDYDNDGRLDLTVVTFQREAKCVYHNEGGGLFTEQSAALGLAGKTAPYVAFGVKWLDYDNDGWLDLMVANGHVQDNIADIDRSATYRQATQLFRNVNGSTLEEMSAQAGKDLQRRIVGRGLAVGDYDNDGRLDVLVVDSEGAPLLLHNETGIRRQAPGVRNGLGSTPDASSNHWLLIRLVGTVSNRNGIGARLTVEAGGRKFLRHCATDGSYMSASDRRVHVGLGQATSATVTIRWSSGGRDVLKNVASDTIYTVTEGRGITDALSKASRAETKASD